MSAWTCHQSEGKAAQKIVPPRLRTPCWKGPGADSEEKREPVSDINTCAVDSLKVLDPKRPIREADIVTHSRNETLWNIRAFLASVCLDANELDHLGPFLGFLRNEFPETGW